MLAAGFRGDQGVHVTGVRRAGLALSQTDVGAWLCSGADGRGIGALGCLFIDAGAAGAESVHVNVVPFVVVKVRSVIGAHRLGELLEAGICMNGSK